MEKSLKVFLLKVCLFTVPIFLLFEIFFRLGLYPIFTTSGNLDAKIISLQKRHFKHIDIIMTGSSVGGYDIVDSAIAGSFNKSYYNLSSWGLQVIDMEALDKTWVERYHPKYLIVVSILSDFRRPDRGIFTNYVNTDNWIKNNFPEYFYFSDYRSISQLIRRKTGASFSFNSLGGQPSPFIHEDKKKHKWVAEDDSFPTAYTQANYNALNSLSSFLKQQQVKLIFIQAPVANSRSGEAFYKTMIARHFNTCKNIVERNNGVYLNYYDRASFSDSMFYDKNHLIRKGAVILTKKIAEDLKNIIK
ncbi:MAG: hypothetical protein V4553_03390 [Bacteroidota bacterium]